VVEDFKRALARVQSDYGFYIDCQANPALALAGYDLSPDESRAMRDPMRLADVLKSGIGISRVPSITIKISGSHDWINRAVDAAVQDTDFEAKVAIEVQAIHGASMDKERTDASVRLMELIG
jgi:hypothetical protein